MGPPRGAPRRRGGGEARAGEATAGLQPRTPARRRGRGGGDAATARQWGGRDGRTWRGHARRETARRRRRAAAVRRRGGGPGPGRARAGRYGETAATQQWAVARRRPRRGSATAGRVWGAVGQPEAASRVQERERCGCASAAARRRGGGGGAAVRGHKAATAQNSGAPARRQRSHGGSAARRRRGCGSVMASRRRHRGGVAAVRRRGVGSEAASCDAAAAYRLARSRGEGGTCYTSVPCATTIRALGALCMRGGGAVSKLARVAA